MRFQGSISLEVGITLFELHPKLYFILSLTFYHIIPFSNYTSANFNLLNESSLISTKKYDGS